MKAKVIVSNIYRTSDEIERWCNSRDLDPIYIQPFSDDLIAIADYFGNRCNLSEITGAIVVIGDGDYLHVWVSWDSRPYLIDADYQKVRLYIR